MIVYDTSKQYRQNEYVDYICSDCGYSGAKRYVHLRKGGGCPVCSGKIVIPGINDIATTLPEVAAMFAHDDDKHRYTKSSGKHIEFRCPVCGTISTKRIADVSRQGLSCSGCSNGVSYPNRVMYALLESIGAEYQREAIFSWSGKKRYDFYLQPNTIIEMNGGQHYQSNSYNGLYGSSTDILINDANKMQLAFANGILHYIIINASKSNIEFLSNSILKSKLAEILDLSSVDWYEIDRRARRGWYDQIITRYNEGATTSEISNSLKIDIDMVRDVLKVGATRKECDYNPIDAMISAALHNLEIIHEKTKKPIRCITTGEEFSSITDAGKKYGVSVHAISQCLNGHHKTSGSLNGQKLCWEYIAGGN